MTWFVFFLLLCSAAVADPSNRCGNIQDDRRVYTRFDSSNGHNILAITLHTSSASGYTWRDIVNDRDKWDTETPWINCTVSIAGAPGIPCVATRRGDWAMESPLPSLKVKFADKLKYKGMDRLLLNKHPWDPTRVKSKLTYELLQNVDGMSSLFTQFVALTVDKTFYGLYTLIEDMDKHMLESHGLGKKANLYKATNVYWDLSKDKGLREVTDPRFNEKEFDYVWSNKGAKNHSILIKAYKEVFDANLNSHTVLQNNFNVNNLATWLAFVYITADADLVFNNYGVYAPEESTKCKWPTPLYFMMWDADGAWDPNTESKLGKEYPYNWDGVQYFWQIRVVKRFLQVNEFVDLLQAKMEYLVRGPLSNQSISTLTNTYKPIIRPTLSVLPDKDNIAWDADIETWSKAVDTLPSIPITQYRRFSHSMRRPMPVDMDMEVSPDKTSIFFFWSKSFILYNKPFYYEFALSTKKTFVAGSIVRNITTKNTFYSMTTRALSPYQKYYWRVLVRNQASPSDYMEGYPSLTSDSGWGTISFTTPFRIYAPTPVPPALNITFFARAANSSALYATLDNLDPTAHSSSCNPTALTIPHGWEIAPDALTTRAQYR
eukprot:Phypoly_transcript_04539.p1 GENE.Phypoly_transcript_04539~~Phypoly_transcript_04539.p1  ORF type:complete len:603 (+),score=52.50 Phypoly_transcript_04539:34-1842(+)